MHKFFFWALIFSSLLSLLFSLYLLIFRELQIYASIFFFFSILIYGFSSIYGYYNENLIDGNFLKKNKKIFKNFLPPFITINLRKLLISLGLTNISKYSAFDNEDEDFKSMLRSSKVYGEYGMGDSTKLALNENLIVYSVDTDRYWVIECKKKLFSKSSSLKWIDFGRVKSWGYPISYNKIDKIDNYLNFIWVQDRKPDLVLIDGRFRVACFLTCLLYADEGTLIIFDDYPLRENYHIVERFINPFDNNYRQSFFKVPNQKFLDLEKINELMSHFKYVMD